MGEHRLLYLVGIPGAGKSTLMRAVLPGDGVSQTRPFQMHVYPGGVMLGGWRLRFSGTDVLPMDVQPRVLRWLEAFPCPVVVGEGDRLGNRTFFEAVRSMGWLLDVVLLDTPLDAAAYRRESRGSLQDHTWVAGRISKVAALGDLVTLRLDGSLPHAVLAANLASHPAFARLRGSGSVLGRKGAFAFGAAFRGAH